jgi:peptidoglycan hydrolase CwlO-like protein
MIHINKTTIFLVMAAVGVWGCSRSSPTDGRDAATMRALEAKVTKLEEDMTTLQAAREHLRQKVDGLEKERTSMNRALQALIQERNELRGQLTARITERDAVQAQYDNFRKEIRNLVGQADAAAAQPLTGQPISAASLPPPTPGKS